ncbi:MAG: penicillin-binding protein 2 [Thermoleophilia bacterium]|nr:penicillin-binding protein 2 [Thermoleophilia bacterium]
MASWTGDTPARPGRFLPGDPRVEEPYRLTPQLAFRVAILAFVALGVFAVLFLRLWALQVLSGDKYLAVANDNRVRTLRLEAPRGPVIDSNGHVLVENVPGTRVELWPADLPKNWPAQRRELRALSDVTGIPLREILAQMNRHAGDPLTPIVVQRGLRQDQILYLREHGFQFPGVRLAHSYLRKYPYRALAAQVLGYVGQISPEEYKTLKKRGYQPTDSIGQAGIESTYDTYLRGKDGKAQLTVDSRGRPKGAITPLANYTPGQALRLTIDIGLQRAAEKALVYGIQRAHDASYARADGGAIVALNPNDGAILAMASYPTYQPSIFVGRKDPKKLAPLLDPAVAEADNHPGINRAINAAYPPGSTFKPVTALAAMQEHLVTPYQTLLCSPDYLAYKQTFHNWTDLIYQWIDLKTALAMSCDTYFYELGKRFYLLPPDRGHPLQGWANRFGLGEKTSVDVGPEVPGLIPTPEWRRQAYPASQGFGIVDRTWKPGYSIQMAIGQGQILVTPLQMARLYALIANGGKLVTPHIADDVELTGSGGQPARVLRRFGAQPAQPTGVDPTALSYVQQGLEEATHSAIGTSAGVFGSFPVDIAGKTGSAEKTVRLPGFPNPSPEVQSWWCGYGPYDKPTIVVCALIENGGHGGTSAAPAALKVFEHYFGKTGQLSTHISD